MVICFELIQKKEQISAYQRLCFQYLKNKTQIGITIMLLRMSFSKCLGSMSLKSALVNEKRLKSCRK